jgi:tRNA 2-thiouridine synthesizing protein A
MGETQGQLGSEVFYDFGEMSCGDLLIALLKAMRPLPGGTLVEVRALDPGAPIDIPAWCRMVGHTLLVRAGGPQNTHYLIRKEGHTHGEAPD